MQKLVKAAKEGTKDGLEKTKAAVKKGRSFIKTKSFCQGLEDAFIIDYLSNFYYAGFCFLIKIEIWIKSCSLFREEVILFWRWGVWTLYWGGLFQRWARFLSSTRWSHTATGTMFPSLLLHLHDSCFSPLKDSSQRSVFFSLRSWWEDVSWVLSWRVRRTILMRWKGYWRYEHKVTVSTNPLPYDFKCSFPTLSALSALWETPVPDWAEAAEWQEAENNLLSGEGDLAVPLPLSDRPSQPRSRVGQPGNDRGCLCGIGRMTFHTAL